MRLEARFIKRMGSFLLDVNFLAEDEIMAILGPSGCGKSMTLKCIAGIEQPDQGYIRLGDRVLYDSDKGINLPPQERRVGYMFQEYALFPNMTVRENVEIAYRSRKQSGLVVNCSFREKTSIVEFISNWNAAKQDRALQQNRMVSYILDHFHISDIADLYPRQLSGGQKQRTAMARMLAAEPDLILLDEPFTALDAQLRWAMEQEISEGLKEAGRTSLFVSHSRDEVYRLCNSVCTMTGGKMNRKCLVRELFEAPLTVAEASISGCRNITPCVRSGDYEIYVPAWDITLRCDRVVADDISHVGIRAHYFTQSVSAGSGNVIQIVEKRIVEEPFEWNIDFRTTVGGTWLHWRVSKEILKNPQEMGDQLWVASSHVMLLRG